MKSTQGSLIRVLSFILFVILVVFTVGLGIDKIGNAGFPDGYITAFEISMLFFYKITLVIYSINAVFFLIIGLKRSWHQSKWPFWLNLTVTFLVSLLIFLVLPWYFDTILHLDHGQGG